MLITEPTPEMLSEWISIFKQHRASMKPNKKSGEELDEYFRLKYAYEVLNSEKATEVVRGNIMNNAFHRGKLPNGVLPDIRTYMTDGVFVGIDLVSGFIHVECEDMSKAVPIYDDLFVYGGLDEHDIENPFLFAEYYRLTH